MKSKTLVVFWKELKESLRDKRALGMLALFVLMYPAIVGFVLHDLIKRSSEPEREGVELVVIGSAHAPTLMTQLKQKNISITEHKPVDEDGVAELLRSGKSVAVLKIDGKFVENYHAMRPAQLELWFDSGAETGRKLNEVENVLNTYTSNIARARLLAHGVSPVNLQPVVVQRYDTGTSATRSGKIIGAMLGTFFIPVFIFCLSTAVDSTAGERERRSLEVLMAQPITSFQLVSGKLLAAAALSVIGITLELLFAHGILKWIPLEELGLSWRLSTLDLALVILTAIPLCLFAAAFELALAMNAKSFKEAQSTLSIAMVIPMLPIFLVPMFDLTNEMWMFAVPLLSNITLLREMSKGQDLTFLHYALTVGSSLLAAAVFYAFATWRMKSEKYVLAV